MRIYNCAYCGKEQKYKGVQYSNKFCDNVCSGAYLSQQNKQLWSEGKAEAMDRATIRKYISEDRGYKCESCGISDWNGKPLTLQVDHIDGNAGDHTPTNVRLLCPNCHSQSDTFSGANKGYGRKARGLSLR